MKRLLRSPLFLLLLTTNVFAQDNQFRVQVRITADSSLESRIGSIVRRELRALGDVVITDTNPEYKIEIIAMQLETGATKRVTGYAMTSSALHVIQPSEFSGFEDRSDGFFMSRELAKFLVEYFSFAGYGNPVDYRLFAGSLDDLRVSCEKLVAGFDSEVLEFRRTILRRAREEREQ